MKDKISSDLMTGFVMTGAVIFGLIFGGLIALYGVWAAAFVGVHLWTWFVVPVFGLAQLTLPQAFGLSLIIGYWTHQHYAHYDKDERPPGERIAELVGIFISPWVILLMGWICHTYFMGM